MLQYKETLPYPNPSPIRISTISALSHLRMHIDLDEMFARLPLVAPLADQKKQAETDGTGTFTYGVQSMKHYVKEADGTITMHHRHSGSQHDTKKVKSYFQNQLTLVWVFESSIDGARTANAFLFNNGKLKTVGLKCDEDIDRSFAMLVDYFRQTLCYPCLMSESVLPMPVGPLPIFTDPYTGEGATTLQLYDTRATMYNTDFSTGFRIMRDELFQLVVMTYKLTDSEFEPDIYPACKIKFHYNTAYLPAQFSNPDSCVSQSTAAEVANVGKCQCTVKCNGKGTGDGNGNCKIVTMCVFQSGKIIITGANHLGQVHAMYRFINLILQNHYDTVYYREPFIAELPPLTPSKMGKSSKASTPNRKSSTRGASKKDTPRSTPSSQKAKMAQKPKQPYAKATLNTRVVLPKPPLVTDQKLHTLFFGSDGV